MTGLQKIVIPSEKKKFIQLSKIFFLPTTYIPLSFISRIFVPALTFKHATLPSIIGINFYTDDTNFLTKKIIFSTKELQLYKINSPTTNILPNAPSDDRQGKK